MAPITLLAGDLGGTKTLLATYQVDGSSLIKTRSERYASGQWPNFNDLVAHFLAGCEVQPSAGCLAVAGRLTYRSPRPACLCPKAMVGARLPMPNLQRPLSFA